MYKRQDVEKNAIRKAVLDKKIRLDVFKALLMSGTALSESPCRDAAIHLSEKAKQKNIPVILDIDFRLIAWKNLDEYSLLFLKFLL